MAIEDKFWKSYTIGTAEEMKKYGKKNPDAERRYNNAIAGQCIGLLVGTALAGPLVGLTLGADLICREATGEGLVGKVRKFFKD